MIIGNDIQFMYPIVLDQPKDIGSGLSNLHMNMGLTADFDEDVYPLILKFHISMLIIGTDNFVNKISS